MTKDEKQLAKELFVKTYRSDQYLTEQTRKWTIGTIKNAILVSKLFHEVLKEEPDDSK